MYLRLVRIDKNFCNYNIASLENAKQKLKRAEDSSNLSSADDIETSRCRMKTIQKRKKNDNTVSSPPIFNSSKYLKDILFIFKNVLELLNFY